ncbi:flagellar hook-length control protein FliK [Pectobacterium sp. CFBP8739]|uniref:flagellar hook-length control protein FliK n=1 Tax=Pectobacterium sp. CFBP8739 TaxID=2748908 RepID=UPI0015DF350A|nr:flagellar hook-length control protein FliK [Pectobacterium sp. CFBP8739]MBA0167927.1 flagellar hook-length control protein FliK [Pectobacterium sp. CFBP8739]
MNLSALPIATTVSSDTSSSSASLLTQGELPKDFVDLLSKHISQVTDTSDKKTLNLDKTDQDALLDVLGKEGTSLSRDDLNTLLSSFSSLTGTAITAGKQNPEMAEQAKFKDLDKKESASTSDDDTAIQTLFAMLQTAPLPTQTPASTDNLVTVEQYAGLNIPALVDTKRQNEASTAVLNDLDENTKSTLATTLLNTLTVPNTAVSDKNSDTSRSLPYTTKLASQTSITAESADDNAAKVAQALTHSFSADRNGAEQVLASGNSASQTTAPVVQAMHVPPASVGTTTPASQATSAQLNAPFGSPQWQDALGQQIVMFSRNGQQTAELRLNPQELGALHISLKIDDNQAQIHLASANSQVRSALEAALPHLRNAMAESGINLGQSSVGSDSSAWQQQMASNNNDGNSRGPSYQQQFGHSAEGTGELLHVPEQLNSMASSVNGVDIFA